jgi:MSHA biogenesis protein MshI
MFPFVRMGLFKKDKPVSGWMAISSQEDGLCAAHVVRVDGGSAVVESAVFHPDDPAATGARLLEKLGRELQAQRYRCTTLLRSGEYQLLSVDAPNAPPDELKLAIRWRLKDMLDYHVDDATIDVLDVPADKSATVKNHAMFAVAARNQVIQAQQTVFEEARIPLTVIDIPEMAQRNISALLETEGRGLALLSFGRSGGLLTMTFGGELYLSRRLDVTASQLRSCTSEQKAALYERITLELQRSLDHFDRQYHFIPVAKLMLCPSAMDDTDLREHLASNLYVSIETLDLKQVFDFSKTPDLRLPEMQQRYFMTLGAALRHEEKTL